MLFRRQPEFTEDEARSNIVLLGIFKLRQFGQGAGNVRYGSWLCENAKTLNRDRRSYSSKTVLVAQRASGFNLEIELKNIILRRVSIFEFLHSQGQSVGLGRVQMSPLYPQSTDIVRPCVGMSQMCHFRTHASQQIAPSFGWLNACAERVQLVQLVQ